MALEPSSSNPREFLLYSMPGLRERALLPSAVIRGAYTTTTGRTFLVTSTTLFELFPGWSFTSIGTVPTGTLPVSMTDDGIDLVLSVEGQGFRMPLATNVLAALPTTGPATFGTMAYLDARILTVEPGTRRFWYSDVLDAGSWPALNFYEAAGRADDLLTLVVDQRQLWLFGSQTTEIWFSTGDALSPFARQGSAFIEQGAAGRFCAVPLDNRIYWLGGTSQGEGPVWAANGYTPERISTFALETALRQMPTIGDTVMFSARQGGHAFLGLDFPSGGQTWLYDTSTGVWSELAELQEDGTLTNFRSNQHCLAFDTVHIFGDRHTGAVYEADPTYHRYGQKERYCARVGPFLRQENERFRIHKVELLGEMGIGMDGNALPDSMPQLRLAITEDGLTWGYERWTSAGKIGQRTVRATWRQCGMHRAAALRIACSDPVPLAWRSVSLEVS